MHLRIPTYLINKLKDIKPPEVSISQILKDLLIDTLKNYIEEVKTNDL